MISDNINILYNITYGNPERVYSAIFYNILSDLINMVPFIFTVIIVLTIFDSFDGSGNPLNKTKIWIISICLFLYMAIMYYFQIVSYNHNYFEAYQISSIGRMELAQHILRLPIGTIYSEDSGEMVNILMNEFTILETSITHWIPQFCASLIVVIITFIGLLFIDWRLDLITFSPFCLSLILIVISTNIENSMTEKLLSTKKEINSCFQEYLEGIHCIKAFNLIGTRFNRLEKAFRKNVKDSLKVEICTGPLVAFSSIIIKCGTILNIVIGVYFLDAKIIPVSTFIIFLIISNKSFERLAIFIHDIITSKYCAVAGKHIQKLLDLPIMEGTTNITYDTEKDIIFKNVYFKYSDNNNNNNNSDNNNSNSKEDFNNYHLKNINIEMKQGKLTALVGPSGSGKSTILKLISKFYNADNGEITYAGVNISKIDPEFYMKNISVVFQDVYLFQDTIADNIKFGNDDATEEEIIAAANKACIHDFIMSLPKGYDTMVGEGGCTLSGGEKQRISIARAILKDSPVVLLDEATSSLDPENEVEVQKAISELIAGRTVIVISHHLRTIKEADNIIVLNEGEVVEQGTHEQLMNNNGLYKHLWIIQERNNGWSMK
ncbi:ABC transporter [Anaeromyces robustus]|uniref:ABC transporter n=1 Tax=Anaeromyces robustus TaxID=1754192 RepID=A0A1Y1W5R2_9FUNG|nr:ABC transporter [Anaeromyces robustus]|eukprot:ORX68880.1 ABC transporter [Anaeromyces robustus]